MNKRLAGGLAALLLLLAAVALSLYLAIRDIRRDIGPQLEQTAAAEPTPVTTRHSPAADDGAARAAVTIAFVTADGAPAEGVAFTLAGVSARSDRDGLAVLEGPLGLQQLHFENNWVGNPSTVFIREAEAPTSITVYRTCPGRVRVSKDGAPFSGRIRFPYGVPKELDAQGWAFVEDRLCGPTRLTATGPDGYQRFRVKVLGDEDIVLEVPESGEAWLLVRDPEGRVPEGVSVFGREPTEPGRFHIVDRGEQVRVRIGLDGAEVSAVEVPLDGREHTAVIPDSREVEVHVLCELSCPDTIRCAASECSGELPTFTCSCPRALTKLTGETTDAMFDWKVYTVNLASVPPGVDQLTVEIPDSGAELSARWTGPPFCIASAWVRGVKQAYAFCDDRGVAHFEELLPTGPVLIEVWTDPRPGRAAARGYAAVHLEEGAVEEVTIAPDQGLGEVQVIASEPLDGARIRLSPGPSAILDASGRFAAPLGVPVGLALTLADGRSFAGTLEPGDRSWRLDDQVQTGWGLDP